MTNGADVSPQYSLGNGAPRRRRRASMGLHRSRNHLANRRRKRLGSDGDEFDLTDSGTGWIKLAFLFLLDVMMMGINVAIWSFANVFLWFFSKIHNRILGRIVGYHYLYNVSWEDPRVDRNALKLTDKDHVITIASACDNVLDFIIDGAKVTAVDLNPCQLALCELKKAAIIELPFEEFFAIFALQDTDLLRSRFHLLRPHMDSNAIEFWDKKLPSFGTFMYSGSSGWLAFILFRILFPVLGFGWIRQALEDGVSREEFRQLVKAHEGRLEFIAWVADSILAPIFAPLAGVPEAQLKLGNEREGNFHTIIERVFLNTDLVEDNYFFLGYILGRYTSKCCPRYLKMEHFDALKEAMRNNKLVLFHGTVAQRLRLDALAAKPTKYTAAIMLDHLDWLDDAGVNEELALLWPLLDDTNGRILWRSFASEPHRAPLKYLQATKVDDGSGDRTGMYWGVWVARKEQSGNQPELPSENLFWNQPAKMTVVEKLLTGVRIVTFPVINKVMALFGSNQNSSHSDVSLQNNKHAQKIEAFYVSQAKAYDAFRENFLHARPMLATCMPLPPGKLTWVDVGAGTARNLEFFPIETIKRRFEKIYILDISASLLEVARERIEAAGLSDVVELIHADFTDLSPQGREALPAAGKADLVTFSYSLSMIPDKRSALVQAARLVRPGGSIGIADFYHHGPSGDYKGKPLVKLFAKIYDLGCKLWFKQDGVHLLNTMTFSTIEPSEVEVAFFERFRGAVPLLPVLRPWHGCWIARKPAVKGGDVFKEEDEDSAFATGAEQSSAGASPLSGSHSEDDEAI